MKNNKYIEMGGKGYSLDLLKRNNFLVPDFFILSYKVALDFFKYNNIFIEENKFEIIQDKILSAGFSDEQKEIIFEKFDALSTDYVAVRSSASNEDGEIKSFAGQYESYLYINKENLLDAIKKCWSSFFNSNAINYSENKNVNFSMNVIIQVMIKPDYSGVAFSLLPVSSSTNYCSIEVCEGIADKLVSGEIIPTKYTVRKKTKRIDQCDGKDIMSAQNIALLTEEIIKIEKPYNKPVDVEWCFKGEKLYIIQARPITAFAPKIEEIKNVITRNKRMWQLECYCEGELKGIKRLTNNLYYQNPILYFVSPQKTEIYYTTHKLEEYPELIFRTLDEDYESFLNYYNEAVTTCEEIIRLIEKKTYTINDLYNKLVIIYPFETLGNISGRDWKISERVKKKLAYFRDNYDSVYYKSEETINNYIDNTIPQKLKKYVSVLTMKELNNLSAINIATLEERLKGFIYYEEKIFNTNFETFCKEEGFFVDDNVISDSADIIQGQCAYPGKVIGTAKIIYSKEDFSKFERGNIIVSSMTTPKFIEIMREASGFVTDEGGTTCHAAIVSREIKKPCLIGCKVATKYIRDGDKIELDSEKGIVRILKLDK